MKFYDRTEEIEKLQTVAEKSKQQAQFTVLTGRRRIGKTQLLLKTFENQTFLYFFVARKAEVLLCQDYQHEIETKLQILIPGTIGSFTSLFEYLLKLAEHQNITLIIDEFQEFFSVNPSVYSDMQRLWDLYKGRSKINLIVAGSVIALMHRIFENNKEPLFGRANHFIKLRPFTTDTLKEILKDYHPNSKPDDLLALYSFTGGVAKYVEALMDEGAVSKEEMITHIISRDSLFIQEGKNTLIEEFGKDYAIYFSILTAIASGYQGRTAIEDLLKREIGGYLTRLEKDFQLISKTQPMFTKSRTKNIKYRIEDNFLFFWFRFIYKYSYMAEIEAYNQLQEIVKRDYNAYSGMMLEKYFRIKAIESKNYTAVGNYWDRKGENEIDLIALNEISKQVEVAETKRNKDKISLGILRQKMDSVLTIYPKLKKYQIQYKSYGLEDML
ncbi:MAG: AAA family ATPase [Pigmentiphaga sp.]|nr:AAA family ATPase [Pigmentiphaga sp.]